MCFQKIFNARWNTLFSWSGNYCAKIIIWHVTVKLSKTTSIYHMFYQIDFSSISFHMCFQKSVLNKRGGWKIFWIWINGVAGIRMSRVRSFESSVGIPPATNDSSQVSNDSSWQPKSRGTNDSSWKSERCEATIPPTSATIPPCSQKATTIPPEGACGLWDCVKVNHLQIMQNIHFS